MAKENPRPKRTSHPKLPRLSEGQKISKRPLLHPAIPHPRTNSASPKIVYISTRTPFIAACKRVRTLLSHVENRASGPVNFSKGPNAAMRKIEEGIAKRKGKEIEEVVIKGTGRAVEKVLRLATWWMAQGDCRVVIRTGSAGAVDDIVSAGDRGEGEEIEEEGESRARRVSCLEIGVSLR